MTKMTKRDKFAMVAAILEDVGADEFLVEAMDNEVALLDKRAAKGRGLTKDQKVNEDIKETIVGILNGADAGMNATDVGTAIDETTQKATALLGQLVKAGVVIRTEGKGKTKTVFTLA